jgi:signal transduction histidine kinase
MKTRFRQINILFTVLLVSFVAILVITRIIHNQQSPDAVTVWTATAVEYAAFAIVFLVMIFVRENRASHLIQVVTLVLLGSVVVAYIAPKELGGDMVFVIAAALAYKYGMLRTRPWLKIGLIFGTLIVARGIGIALSDSFQLSRGLNLLVANVVTVLVLYWTFEDEFLRLTREHRRLETVYREHQPFMEFGRNVTGIVHDFKNDLALFDTYGQFLALSQNEPLDASQVDRYRTYVGRLAKRIERITTITQAAQRYDDEERDLRVLLESALYVFQSNLSYRRVITFDVSLPEEPLIARVPPAPVVSIFENILSNSCEALMEESHRTDPGYMPDLRISVSTERDDDNVTIRIDDTGPGLPFCRRCGTDNCLYCSSVGLGQTTKEQGSGIGLVTIRRHSETYGIPVHISNRDSGGVRATVQFTPERVLLRSERSIGVDG